ncbi:hypothetical protein GCM10022200_02290 [Microbacterium awajiense]|uniref:Uncharacterized protein n=1 Tax=Microbacterium awajiense TaxID=415214 RepID=A0ABP7A2D7_9MICO
MTDDHYASDQPFEAEDTSAPDHAAPTESPQYGVGPFSIREVALGGVWIVAFVVSFFSISAVRFDSVWTSGLLWILTIAVPTVAVFLLVLRRLSPDGIRRVGSLGIDQFASVAFSVSAMLWLQLIWETVAVTISGGPWLRSWVIWVEFILMLAGVVLTVFAPLIPPFSQDFAGRREVPAHRNARPVRAVSPRPARERAAVVDDTPAEYAEPAPTEQWSAPVDAGETFEPAPQPQRQQAFWALAPEERDIVDDDGAVLFRIGPTAWALVIEEREELFVVRHEDGRVGYLHDTSDVTRG